MKSRSRTSDDFSKIKKNTIIASFFNPHHKIHTYPSVQHGDAENLIRAVGVFLLTFFFQGKVCCVTPTVAINTVVASRDVVTAGVSGNAGFGYRGCRRTYLLRI